MAFLMANERLLWSSLRFYMIFEKKIARAFFHRRQQQLMKTEKLCGKGESFLRFYLVFFCYFSPPLQPHSLFSRIVQLFCLRGVVEP